MHIKEHMLGLSIHNLNNETILNKAEWMKKIYVVDPKSVG